MVQCNERPNHCLGRSISAFFCLTTKHLFNFLSTILFSARGHVVWSDAGRASMSQKRSSQLGASGAVAIPTQPPGPTVPPGSPYPLPHALPRMPRYFVRAPFSVQTPVERSERVAGCWAVRARANTLSLGVWHFTLRFVLPRSWVGYPCQRPKGCGMQSPLGPKVYPKPTSIPLGWGLRMPRYPRGGSPALPC